MKKFTKILVPVILFLLIQAEYTQAQWTSLTMQSSRYRLAAAANGRHAMFHGGIGLISIPPPAADIYSAATGAVSPRTISQGRTDLAGASCGTKILFAGGANDWILSVYAEVEVYDGVTSGWSNSAALSSPRCKLVGTSEGGKIYFAGGVDFYAQQKVYKVVDIYDTLTATWTTANMSVARHSLAAASAGGKVVFAGGASFSNQPYNTVDILDVASGTWTTDSLSVSRYGCTATAVGNKIYIAGGIDSVNASSDAVDIYDVTTGTWTYDHLTVGRGYLGSAAVGDLIFFAGGSSYDYTSVSDVVDIYNTTTQTWSTSHLTTERTLAASTSINDLFMIGGGINDGGNPLNTIEVYSLITALNDPSTENNLLSVFPNPVNDYVNLKLVNTISNGTLEILNELGQTVYSSKLNNSVSELTINFAEFAKGVYTVKINDGKNSSVKRFVKN